MFDQIIIIPAYKPSEQLLEIIDELREYFNKIVVVNDGSGEQCAYIFNKLEGKCTVLTHHINQGKGRALKTAFNYCLGGVMHDYSGVITADADGQHKIQDIISISKSMGEEKEKIIIGCRRFDSNNVPFRSRVGNTVSRICYRWLCDLELSDTQTGLRGLPKTFLQCACGIQGERYEYETNMLLVANEMKIGFLEVPIETVYENNNASSHFNPLLDSVRIYTALFKYSISSLLSVIIDFLIFWILNWLSVPVMCATYIARICAAIVNFGMNRKHVFKKNDSNLCKQLIKYASLLIVSGTISGLTILIISNLFLVNKLVIKCVVEVVLYFMNYYVQRKFIF